MTVMRRHRHRPAGGGQRPGGGAPKHQGGRAPVPGRDNASARRNYERYVALAREAAAAGDTIEMENCYQHAEHYFRMLREWEG